MQSGQEVFGISRVGSGRVTLTRPDPRELTRIVKKLFFPDDPQLEKLYSLPKKLDFDIHLLHVKHRWATP